jgi:hypothetical protein
MLVLICNDRCQHNTFGATLPTNSIEMRMCMLMTFAVHNDLFLLGGDGRLDVSCVGDVICSKLGQNVEEITVFA